MTTKRFLVGILSLMVVLAGCATTTSPPAKTETPAAQTPAAPAPKKDLGKVTIVQSVQTLSFAPMYVAQAKNYFKDEGIDATVVAVNGGAEANAAIVGKSAEFGAVDSSAVPQLVEKGIEVIAFQSNVNAMTMGLVVRKDVADKLGLKRDMPLNERLAKLKGLTIGITGPGAATDTYTRYYLRKAGFDPDKDAKLVALGGGPALTAALKQGQIDAFQLSPPTPETLVADGTGVLVIASSLGDVPEFKFPYEVVLARADYAKANPDHVRAVARAVSRANNFILQNPAEATKLLQEYFKSTKPEILEQAVKNVATSIPKDGLMDKAGWENLGKIMLDAKQITKPFDATEGKYWTNEYVKDLNGLADRK